MSVSNLRFPHKPFEHAFLKATKEAGRVDVLVDHVKVEVRES